MKDTSAFSMRKSMTQRRQNLSAKVRKSKKSQQLQVKRRHISSSLPQASSSSQNEVPKEPQECLQFFINSPSAVSLSALQASLASSKQTSPLSLLDIPNTQAEQFINLLATTLTTTTEEVSVLHTLRILTNLAAMECPDAYYTSSASWCSLILSSKSSIPSALLELLSSSKNESVLEQVCWVIGNIAGDSQQCREQLISMNFIPSLVGLSRQVLSSVSDVNPAIDLRRNICWALSNIARGNNPALPFVQGGLNCNDILHMLKMDSTLTRSNEWDVRKELYWLLAFLTAKEDEIIEHIVNEEVIYLLSRHLDYVTNVIIEKRDRGSIFQSVIPLIRILGNLSTAAGGKYIPGVIAVDGNAIIKSLAKWLQVYKPCGETITIANEATWVIGALLCDVGYPDHPSTTIACPILLPALCNVLASGTFTLEWKREVLNAIWNALAAPPGSNGDDTLKTRDELLLSIYKTKGMIRALVGLCTCMDVDAIRPAVNIIDAFHRRMGRHDENVARVLEEAECLHALEHICDAASSSASYSRGKDWSHDGHSGGMDYCADMAANLIDDFYDGDEEEVNWELGGSRSSAEFEFGVQGPNPTFSFGESHNSQDSFDGRRSPARPPTLGRGRGRGRVQPAWMLQNH